MRKIITVIWIISIVVIASGTYVYVNDIKNEEIKNIRQDYEERLEIKKLSYNELLVRYENSRDYLFSQIDCLTTGNININPEEEKSRLIGMWNLTVNGTIVGNEIYGAHYFGEDNYYWPGPTGLFHSWKVVNTSCGMKIIILGGGISSIYSYSLSENNTVLTIGENIYKKTS